MNNEKYQSIFDKPARQFASPEEFQEAIDNQIKAKLYALPFNIGHYGEDSAQYLGYNIKIEHDEIFSGVFDEEFPEGFGLHISTRNYEISNGEDCPVDYEEFLRWSYGNDYEPEGELRDYWLFNHSYYWLPIYMYSHSGDTVNTTGFSCRWDSGMVGIVFIKKSEFMSQGYYGVVKGWKAERRSDWAEVLLKSWVQGIDDDMTGNRFGFIVEKLVEDGEPEELDSCWGFSGESGRLDAIEQAKAIVEYYDKERKGEN